MSDQSSAASDSSSPRRPTPALDASWREPGESAAASDVSLEASTVSESAARPRTARLEASSESGAVRPKTETLPPPKEGELRRISSRGVPAVTGLPEGAVHDPSGMEESQARAEAPTAMISLGGASAAGTAEAPTEELEGGSASPLGSSVGSSRLSLKRDSGGFPELGEIGPWELVRKLGEGGMGAVWEARHRMLDRRVALKLVRCEGLSSQARERFAFEAQILARLRHPGIVRVYDVEVGDDWMYFTMDLVAGGSLADRIASEGPLSEREALIILADMAEALDEAHDKFIVHRDLKPGNILLRAGEDEEGHAVLTDFGIAKELLETDRRLTRTGAVVGTPNYMAPEQVEAGGRIDRRTDIYSLGATIYEALTGRPPFDATSPVEVLAAVVSVEPVSITKLRPDLSPATVTMLDRCLVKEPDRRYGTARELAEDCRRHLRDEPIKARPIGVLERAGAWRRGHRRALILAGFGALFMIVASIALVVWQARNEAAIRAEGEEKTRRFLLAALRAQQRAEDEQRRARKAAAEASARRQDAIAALERSERAEREARRRFLESYVEKARTELEAGRLRRAAALVGVALARPDEAGLEDLMRRARHLGAAAIGRSGWLWRSERALEPGLGSSAWSPSGRHFAIFDGRAIRVFETLSGRLVASIEHESPSGSIAFVAEESLVASSGPTEIVRLDWRRRSYEVLSAVGLIGGLRASPKGRRVGSIGLNGVFHVWDLEEERSRILALGETDFAELLLFDKDRGLVCSRLDGQVDYVAENSGDDRTLISAEMSRGKPVCLAILESDDVAPEFLAGFADGTVRRYDLKGRPLAILGRVDGPVTALSASRSGTRVLASTRDAVKLLTTETVSPPELPEPDLPVSAVRAVELSPDGRSALFLARSGGEAWLVNLDTGRRSVLRGHRSIDALALSPDGRMVWTGAGFGGLMARRAVDGRFVRRGPETKGGGFLGLWCRDQGGLAAVTRSGELWLTSEADGSAVTRPVIKTGEELRRVALSRLGGRLAWLRSGSLELRDLDQSSTVIALPGFESAVDLAWRADGRLVVLRTTSIEQRDGRTGAIVGGSPIELPRNEFRQEDPSTHRLICAPLGRATALIANGLFVCEGGRLKRLEGAGTAVVSAAFGPNGRSLAVGLRDGRIQIWRDFTEDQPVLIEGLGAEVSALAWSNDGLRLFAASRSGIVRGFALSRSLLMPELGAGAARAASFSEDGRRIAVLRDRVIELWETTTGRRAASFIVPEAIADLTLSLPGDIVTLGYETGAVERREIDGRRLWRAELPGRGWHVAESPAGVLAISLRGEVRLLDRADGRVLKSSSMEVGRLRDLRGTGRQVHAVFGMRHLAGFEMVRGVSIFHESSGASLALSAAISPDGRFIAEGDRRGRIRLHGVAREASEEPTLRRLWGHGSPLLELTIDAEDRLLIALDRVGRLSIWHCETGERSPVPFHVRKGRRELSVAPGGRWLAIAGASGLELLDLKHCTGRLKVPDPSWTESGYLQHISGLRVQGFELLPDPGMRFAPVQ